MGNKTKSKWFVVATEGATTDGRAIHRSWIEQMAKNYDLKTYGARINLEHIKLWFYRENEPHAKCYGDVLGLKAEENAEGKLQLFALIDPTEELIALNKNRQKIYTSIEVDPNFADSGEAYLVGLAVTDSPASLGTEMLQFAANASQNPFAARKQKAENLFSACIETQLEFEIEESPKPSLFSQIKAMFSKAERNQEQRFNDVDNAVLLLSEEVQKVMGKYTALLAQHQALSQQLQNMSAQVEQASDKLAQLEQQPAPAYSQRPKVTGEQTNQDGRFF